MRETFFLPDGTVSHTVDDGLPDEPAPVANETRIAELEATVAELLAIIEGN